MSQLENRGSISGTIQARGAVGGKIGDKGHLEGRVNNSQNDYELLKNKPKLDGREIIGDIPELDPTVPNWAKEETKPSYTYEETGAVGGENEVEALEIEAIFKAVFGL